MKAYFYQRKQEDGTHAKEWSYRLRNVPRDLPREAWADGFKRNGTLWTSKARTVEHVQRQIEATLAAFHAIRMGRPPVDRKDITKHIPPYLAWGKVQGGTRREMGWAEGHAEHVETYLNEWVTRLGLRSFADLQQPAFRREYVKMLAKENLAPNTVNHRCFALVGWCRWAVEEKLLPAIPIQFKALDKRPRNERGKFYPDEVAKLIQVAPPARGLIYHAAYVTSYRKKAITRLRVGYIDWMALTIGLDYLSAKNRKKTLKPLTPRLAEALFPLCQGRPPEAPLFPWFNPKQAVKRLRDDMERAGIPLRDRQGLVRDFHSLKASFGAALDNLGTEPKVMQQALDHATFQQTLTYLKRELAPLRTAAAEVEAALFGRTSATEPGENPYHARITGEQSPTQPQEAAMSYENSGGIPHPPRYASQSSAKPGASSATAKSGKIAGFPEVPQTSYKDAQETLARLYHRIGDPTFARLLRRVSDLPPEKVAQVDALLAANRKAGAA